MKRRFLFIFIFSFFMFISNTNAIFIHNNSLLFSFDTTGSVPTCTLPTSLPTFESLNVIVSNINGFTTKYKPENSDTFIDVPIDVETKLPTLIIDHNTTIEMKYVDASGNESAIGTCNITNIDKVKPTIEYDPNGNSVYQREETVTIKTNDNVGINKVYYYVSNDNENVPDESIATLVLGNGAKNIVIPVELKNYTGMYYIWTKVIDTAGNEIVSVSNDYLLDNTKPNIIVDDTSSSTNNISLKVESSDADSGVDGYYYSTDDGATWTTKQSSGIYMFAGLQNATTYHIRVKVVDKAGNEEISDLIIITTADFGNITVSVDADTWSTFKIATIAFQNQTGVTYQYSTDGGNTWITITSDSTIKYTKNGTFKIKITDGVNTETQEYPITHIDPIPVTINSFTAPLNKIHPTSITVNVDAEDTGDDSERSGIKGYQYSCNNGATYSDLTLNTTYTCANLTPETEYTIKVKVFDNAGNLTESSVTAATNILVDVFLDGVDGDDNDDGSSPTNAVKTFAKAKSLLTSEGTIWICGTVSISDSQSWSLSDYGKDNTAGIIKRWDGVSVAFEDYNDQIPFTKSFINLTSSTSTITLGDIILDGGAVWGGTIDSILQRGDSNAGISTVGRAPLILGNSGTVNLNSGSILQNNNVKQTGVTNNDYGAGIYLSSGKANLNNAIIRNNETNGRSSDGGAISCATGTVTIVNSEIYGNRAGRWGGAIRSKNLVLTNTIIRNNKVVIDVNYASPGTGGALYINGGSASITGGEIKNNYSASHGGGIYLASGTLNLTDTVIINNESLTLGSGIYNNGTINLSGNVKVNNNVNASTIGDVYLPNGKKFTIVNDLNNSNIGVKTAVLPTASTSVDIALPSSGYTLNNTYYNQFYSNNSLYSTDNVIYNTTNNKIILKKN